MICSTVQPAFSWSQLSITEAAFRRMLFDLRVFTPFMHIVHAFGARTNDKELVNDLVYHHMDLSSSHGMGIQPLQRCCSDDEISRAML